jgi:hypothetical protein
VAVALKLFAAIAVCLGTGGAVLGTGAFGLVVGVGGVVGVGVEVGVGACVGEGVDVGDGVADVASGAAATAAGALDPGPEAPEARAAGAEVAAGAGVAAARLAADEVAEAGAPPPLMLPWPRVQAAHMTELRIVAVAAARSGSRGCPGRDRQRPPRDTGTRPG